LTQHQRRTDRDVRVVSFAGEGPLFDRFRREGVEVAVVPKRERGVDPTLSLRLASLFGRWRPAVVHTHDPQSLIYAAMPAKLRGARVIYTKHGDTIETGRRLWLQRGAAAWVDHFVAVSESTAAVARQRREVASRKIHVIPNGVDLQQYKPDAQARAAVRAELGIAEDAWVVGTVGRLEPEKHHALLLRAMAPLLQQGDVKLVIAGDGSLAQMLARLAQRIAPPKSVHFLGQRPDVAGVLASFDVFALSSRTEGLPLAAIEAMACGLPVVATAVGGLPSLIADGRTGLLARAEDEKHLCAQLTQLRADPAGARQMGETAREAAGAYALDRMGAAYELLYG
jgi:glycosyltransferase involved in cell wall biosynthesis